jgi:hypothetical protein
VDVTRGKVALPPDGYAWAWCPRLSSRRRERSECRSGDSRGARRADTPRDGHAGTAIGSVLTVRVAANAAGERIPSAL